MTNYNDGEWHVSNGEKCPVHPETVVEYVWHDPNRNECGMLHRISGPDEAGDEIAWSHVLKFRVTKEYIEPPKLREFWVAGGVAYGVPVLNGIRVREVIE